MDEKYGHDQLKALIERGHFARAAFLAASIGLGQEELQKIRYKALTQMAAQYRNAPGTKSLAIEYGLSKKEVQVLLEKYAEELREGNNRKSLEPCYDHRAGQHLSFQEWLDQLLKHWNKLSTS